MFVDSRRGSGAKRYDDAAGREKDSALVIDKWQKLESSIDGVVAHEVLHVPRDQGVITEPYRFQWDSGVTPVGHAFDSPEIPYAWNRSAQARLRKDAGRS